MGRDEVRKTFRLCLWIILLLSVIQVIPFQDPLIDNVSAGSKWVQTTEQDFLNGTRTNVMVTPGGNVTLGLHTKYVEDDFINESKIIFKDHVIVDTAKGEAKLIKINRTFGGPLNDYGYSVQQIPSIPSGFIIAGYTESYGNGGHDVWLIKTYANGSEEWNKTFGGSDNDFGYSLDLTLGGDYVIVGTTYSYGSGTGEVWLIKIFSNGVEDWNTTYGDVDSWERGNSVQQTVDGGYIIAGTDSDTMFPPEIPPKYNRKILLIKTNPDGSENWNKTWTSSTLSQTFDSGNSVIETSGGDFIVAGRYAPWTFPAPSPPWTPWLVGTDGFGTEILNKQINGIGSSDSILENSDGDYIVAGYTSGGGVYDVWLFGTDTFGNLTLNKTYGGPSDDYGHSVQQTSDSGYIILGSTESYGPGNDDLWLIKTDAAGNEQWNKTFGGYENETGLEIQETSDGDYVIVGNTESYGAGGSDVWLICTDSFGNMLYTDGELTSGNLLQSLYVSSIDAFNCTVSIPANTNITVQFSEDNAVWQNSSGGNGVDILTDGFNSIDLSFLDWSGPNFYYRMAFTSDNYRAPSVQNINVSYSQYYGAGTFESQKRDTGAQANFTKISWTKGQPADNIKFQLRSAASQSGLSLKEYVGPDGLNSTYYETPDTDIWSGHDSDRWIQYKADFSTLDKSISPILLNVTIFYNSIPTGPSLISPADNSYINDTTPEFSWNFNDLDGSQEAFQVLVDDETSFSDVNYDSGEQSSSNQYWQITSELTEGTWYWKVKTQDDGGEWGLYSGHNSFTIDLTPPTITHTPITNGIAGVPINFSTVVTDGSSGVEDVFLYCKKPSESTYTEHQMTANGNNYFIEIPGTAITSAGFEYYIKAVDKTDSPNIKFYGVFGQTVTEPISSTDIDITVTEDTTPPSITHTNVTSGTSGVPITITAVVTDADTGVENVFLYYKKSGELTYTELEMIADGNTYSAEIPGSAVTSPGLEYYIKVTDSVGNIAYYGDLGQIVTEPTSSTDIDITIPVVDTTPPSVSDHTPTGTDVPIDTTITVTFSEAMNQSATQSAFSILPDVSGSYSWSGNQLVFTPDSDLDYSETYNVTIGTEAKDLVGNNLEVFSWEFTTIPGTTGPIVERMEPDKEMDVRVEGLEIEIRFDRNMDPTTTEAAISIDPYVELIPDWPVENLIVLTPVNPLKYDTRYNITVTTSATDENGQHLGVEFNGYFFTEKAPKKEEPSFWMTWEPIITGLTILTTILIALFGVIQLRKKRGVLRQYLEKIDDIYDEYKEDPKECKQELISLREKIKIEVKQGNLEEGHFLILDKKIDEYLMEIKEMKAAGVKGEPIEDIPDTVEEEIGGEGAEEEE